MNLILFDGTDERLDLLPFTYTRPVAGIRCGILTITEKWLRRTGGQVSYLCPAYLSGKYPIHYGADALYVNGALCPNGPLVEALAQLGPGDSLVHGTKLLGLRAKTAIVSLAELYYEASHRPISFGGPFTFIARPPDIFAHNRSELIADFEILTSHRRSQPITDPHTIVYAPEQVFLEEGVQLRAAILNAETGPIYLGKNAIVGEGSIVRGAFALGEGASLNLGAKMRGDTSIGPHCKVGGEVSNSVFFAHSNKGHEGYLGNSVVGEWCNLGADTNTSNLKNNYGQVKLWSYRQNDYEETGRQFCGLMMADHVKCSINTMFNTGTVVGPCVNLFGSGFPPKLVPPFSWGGSEGLTTFNYQKMEELAYRVMDRRGDGPTTEDLAILNHVFAQTAKYRSWEG
ncbi:MAG: GlmU family protein [Bernardetiaceae bacterium]|jgi:UDP-N-acetylglucosamine diphosphorylase/glucosamine-1-phosphate N-acetyltransferase|nr:GlmU family protein [Bernardetiaceae bacterium]